MIFRVTCVHDEINFFGSQHIGLLGLRDAEGRYQRKHRTEVIDDIRTRRAAYVVQRDGYTAQVEVRHRSSGEGANEFYLATVRDGIEVDNLMSLPDCKSQEEAAAFHLTYSTAISDGMRVLTFQHIARAAEIMGLELAAVEDALHLLDRSGKVRLSRASDIPFTAVHVTPEGMEHYLHGARGSEGIVEVRLAVAKRVLQHSDRDSIPIANALNEPRLVVEHFLYEFVERDLLNIVEDGALGAHVLNVAPVARWGSLADHST